MDEREKLDSAVAAYRLTEEAAQRSAHAYAQRESQHIHEMREKLKEITAAFAPNVIVKFEENPSSVGRTFRVNVGDGRTWVRKPFATLEVSVWGNGFRVFNPNEESRQGYRVQTGTFDTVEQVAAVIRDAAAAYVAANGEYPSLRPDWLDKLVYLNAGLLVLAVFALCALFWGWAGMLYGLFAGWIAYHVGRGIGVWGLLLTTWAAFLLLR